MRRRAATRPRRYACGNGVFGCGLGVEWQGFNRRMHACHACCRQAAQRWRLHVQDLPSLLVAYGVAKAARDGGEPALEDVWPVLEKMGVRPVTPEDGVLPEKDRTAAA